MEIQLQNICKITKRNMVMSYKLTGSTTYKRAKLMCIMSMKDRMYYDQPFKKHIEDIEQTLVDYGITDEKFFTALWVANCEIPFKKRIDMFGREIVKLAFGFNKGNIPRKINSITEREKLIINDDIITLHLAQRVANINFAINNADDVSFNMYVNAYEVYEKALRKNEVEDHKKLWEYLEFTCKTVGDLNAFFFYF